MSRNANGHLETELQFDVPDLRWVTPTGDRGL